eukprot:gene15114-17872_t
MHVSDEDSSNLSTSESSFSSDEEEPSIPHIFEQKTLSIPMSKPTSGRLDGVRPESRQTNIASSSRKRPNCSSAPTTGNQSASSSSTQSASGRLGHVVSFTPSDATSDCGTSAEAVTLTVFLRANEGTSLAGTISQATFSFPATSQATLPACVDGGAALQSEPFEVQLSVPIATELPVTLDVIIGLTLSTSTPTSVQGVAETGVVYKELKYTVLITAEIVDIARSGLPVTSHGETVTLRPFLEQRSLSSPVPETNDLGRIRTHERSREFSLPSMPASPAFGVPVEHQTRHGSVDGQVPAHVAAALIGRWRAKQARRKISLSVEESGVFTSSPKSEDSDGGVLHPGSTSTTRAVGARSNSSLSLDGSEDTPQRPSSFSHDVSMHAAAAVGTWLARYKDSNRGKASHKERRERKGNRSRRSSVDSQDSADSQEGKVDRRPEVREERLIANSPWEIDYATIVFPDPCKRLGIGAYGEVFKATWGCTTVAVKKLLDQEMTDVLIKEFRHEVDIVSRLRHPSVVLWLGACTTPPNLALVTEFMEGGSLSHVLHKCPKVK